MCHYYYRQTIAMVSGGGLLPHFHIIHTRKGLLYESGIFYNPLHNSLFTLFDYKDIFASTIISEVILKYHFRSLIAAPVPED